MIPLADFRKDLVKMMKDIRESINEEFAQLTEEEKTKIRKMTTDFLKIASKFPNDDDNAWSKKVEVEMEEIRKNLESIAEELT